MINNYIKIAWRNLWKSKGYTALNIFGLAIGITCAALIFLWVEDELSFDQSINDKELVYAVPTNQKYDGEWRTFFEATPGPLADVLKDEIPEISKAARKRNTDFLFSVGDNSINSPGSYADADLFEIFSLQFIAGHPENAFDNKNSIVITQEVATTLFGTDQNLIGKTLKVNKNSNYTITGVIENFPKNTTYAFSWIVPFENFTDGKEWTQGYGSNFTDTYVKLVPGADFEKVNNQVKAVLPAKKDDNNTEAILFSANDWHLRARFEGGNVVGGRIEYVHLFGFIALIILIIASINFMNMATARSEKRASEVGVRKALGSDKRSLISQFMIEAVLTSAIAGLTSMALILIALPYYNALIDKQLSIGWDNPYHIIGLLGITLMLGIVAGIYPAFYLSSFKPVDVLKGIRTTSGSASIIRKGLVVGQFVISIVFIICTFMVYQQVQHVKNRSLGMVKENLIEIPVSGDMVKNFAIIDRELTSSGFVKSIGLSNSQVLSAGNNSSSLAWQGMPTSQELLVSYRFVTPDFFKTTGMEILQGEGFKQTEAQDSAKVLISESLAKLLPAENKIGQTIDWQGWTFTVQGVVKDYLYGDMYGTSDPVLFYHQVEGARFLYVKPSAGVDISTAINQIENVLTAQNPGFPFEYKFVDEDFDARFKSETLVGNLSQIFALLAVIISCLGLFGLSAYTAEQRKKEIGVRKVLGSSVTNIVKLLSKDFVKLVLIAVVIAIPVGYLLMENWLQDYAYRIDINYWVFLIAAVIAIAIALITVSFQAIKAAIANPVDSLRSE